MTASLPQPSARAREFLERPHRQLIGDRWVDGAGERVIKVENPARETIIAEVSTASTNDLDNAVSAARHSLEHGWGRMSSRDRGRVLQRMSELLSQHAERIAEIETLDMGTPIGITVRTVGSLAVDIFQYYAGWATKISGESFVPNVGGREAFDFLAATLREPIGVVGVIIPWNAPSGMLALKLGPALAAGCTVVLKPAEQAPLVAELFAELLLEAGAPPGTFNLLQGHGADVGAALAAHTGIDKITFTGSTATGRSVVTAALGNLKKVTLELGGKSPFVIFPDADLELAIPAAAHSCFFVSGQACMAGTRLFAAESIYEEVVAGVAAVAQKFVMGDGLRRDVNLGPVISARQKQRILGFIESGRQQGARMVCGGEDVPTTGHFVRPTLFADARPDMRIAQEEIFGPVLTAMRFKDGDEATLLQWINGTKYGLSGSVWTRDLQRAVRMARGIDSGQVGINVHAAVSPETPFGGNRQSGWGREFGREGLDAYLKTKAMTMNLGLRS